MEKLAVLIARQQHLRRKLSSYRRRHTEHTQGQQEDLNLTRNLWPHMVQALAQHQFFEGVFLQERIDDTQDAINIVQAEIESHLENMRTRWII